MMKKRKTTKKKTPKSTHSLGKKKKKVKGKVVKKRPSIIKFKKSISKIKKKMKQRVVKKELSKKKINPSQEVSKLGVVRQQEPSKEGLEVQKSDNLSNITNNAKKFFKKIVPIKNLPRAATGISSFDKMIEGGFKAESVNLVSGVAGSGKSILSLQFLLEGIKKGENVLYITFGEKKKDFYSNMKKFGWDLTKLENSGKFIFLKYSPEKVKMMLDEGGGAIESTVLKHNIKRMVIDSVTSFSLLFDDKLSRRQAALGLFDIISKWSCTTLLTVQDSDKGREDSLNVMDFEADSLVVLHFVRIKNKRHRFLEVVKMRGTNHSKEAHVFEIGKQGIKVGRPSRLKK